MTVADLMLVGDDVPVLRPDQPAMSALDVLQREPGRAVVLDGGTGDEVVGLLSTSDLVHALEAAPPRRDGRPPRRRRTRLGIWAIVLAALVVAAAFCHPPLVSSALGLLAALFRTDREVFALGDVVPSGIPSEPLDRLQHVFR